MSSRINGFSSRPTTVDAGRSVERTRDAVTGGSSGSAAASGQDVHITDAASRLSALEQALRDLPAVDETRVTQIRAAIEQGRYTVQPERIADQLMQLEKALGRLPDPSGSDTSGQQGEPGQPG